MMAKSYDQQQLETHPEWIPLYGGSLALGPFRVVPTSVGGNMVDFERCNVYRMVAGRAVFQVRLALDAAKTYVEIECGNIPGD
jgi:hypothetical protein